MRVVIGEIYAYSFGDTTDSNIFIHTLQCRTDTYQLFIVKKWDEISGESTVFPWLKIIEI